MHPDPTWIVVADSRAARFLLRPDWRAPLTEFTELADSADFLDRRHAPTADAVLPYPGAGFDEAKAPGHDRAESIFLHRVAAEIDTAMTEHEAQALVLCAPPRELCVLRDYISERSRARITCEITIDLVRASVPIIEAEIRRLKV